MNGLNIPAYEATFVDLEKWHSWPLNALSPLRENCGVGEKRKKSSCQGKGMNPPRKIVKAYAYRSAEICSISLRFQLWFEKLIEFS